MPFDEDNVEAFFTDLEGWWHCYGQQTLAFFGVDGGDTIEILLGQVRLLAGRRSRPSISRCGRFIAGSIPLSPQEVDARAVVRQLIAGTSTPAISGCRFVLPKSSDCGLSALPGTRFHQAGVANGKRLSVLQLLGGSQPGAIRTEELDWDLRAADTPYDSVAELLMGLGLPNRLPGRCTVEVIASPVVEGLADSRITGEIATVGLWLPQPAQRKLSRLGFRVLDKGQVVSRGSINGKSLNWSKSGNVWKGTTQIPVPQGSVAQCFAVYAGAAHHSFWITDPSRFPNPRLAAFETVDRALQLFRKYLLQIDSKRGAAAQQFEAAVSWLVWASGLAPAHMALADEAKDGPDILASAPSGGLVVIECTLGLLKAESKLAKVSRRAVTAREALTTAGFPNVAVLPVIVTALPRAEVAQELDAAAEAGVHVLTREDLLNGLEQAQFFMDGDATFRRGIDALAQAKANRQERLGSATSGPN